MYMTRTVQHEETLHFAHVLQIQSRTMAGGQRQAQSITSSLTRLPVTAWTIKPCIGLLSFAQGHLSFGILYEPGDMQQFSCVAFRRRCAHCYHLALNVRFRSALDSACRKGKSLWACFSLTAAHNLYSIGIRWVSALNAAGVDTGRVSFWYVTGTLCTEASWIKLCLSLARRPVTDGERVYLLSAQKHFLVLLSPFPWSASRYFVQDRLQAVKELCQLPRRVGAPSL